MRTFISQHPIIRTAGELLLFTIIALLLYGHTLQVPFIFDDDRMIPENPHIRMTELTWDNVANVSKGPGGFRPVAMFSFALNYYLHDYNLAGYHVVNIVIHIINGFLLYILIRVTLSLADDRSGASKNASGLSPDILAGLASLLWFMHPVQTNAVTYIVQRMTSLAVMFYLLSLLAYIHGRRSSIARARWLWFCAAILFGGLAIGSKEIAATLPFVILLYEWYFFQNLDVGMVRKHPEYFLLGGGITGLGMIVFFKLNSFSRVFADYAAMPFTVVERVMTEWRIMVLYIGLLLYPHPSRLNFDHYVSVSQSLLEPVTTIFSLALIVGLLGGAIVLARTHRLFSFCIVWFFSQLAIESTVVGLELIYEHRMYFPSMLIFLALLLSASRFLRSPKILTAGVCLICVLFGVWTYQRNIVWQDERDLFQDAVMKAPQRFRAYFSLGNAYAKYGQIDEAIASYQKSLEIGPNFLGARYNLAVLFIERGEFDKAISQLYAVLRIRPNNLFAHKHLGVAFGRQGKFSEAIRHFKKVIDIAPDSPEGYFDLALALLKQGKLDEARQYADELLRLDQDYPDGAILVEQVESARRENVSQEPKVADIPSETAETHYERAMSFMQAQRFSEAIHEFSEALRLNPDHVDAHNNLAAIFVQQGKLDEAIPHFTEAIRIAPDNPAFYNNLGGVLGMQGKFAEAIPYLTKALELYPQSADANFNLGIAFYKQGKLVEALPYLQEAVRLRPDYPNGSALLQQIEQELQQND